MRTKTSAISKHCLRRSRTAESRHYKNETRLRFQLSSKRRLGAARCWTVPHGPSLPVRAIFAALTSPSRRRAHSIRLTELSPVTRLSLRPVRRRENATDADKQKSKTYEHNQSDH